MSGLLGLVRIETRRSIGLWTCIPLIVIAVWLASVFLPVRIWLWPDSSQAIRATITIVGPLAAGITAWMAGRDRRRKIGDLLTTMPCPAPARNLATWSGTALWTVGAYMTAGAILLGLTAWNATGGSPVPFLPIITVGIIAVIMHTAFGYLAGHYLPSRFAAPLIAVLLFVGQAVPAYSSRSIKHLSPIMDFVDSDVFYGLRHDLSIPKAVWLLGLAGAALALVALRGRGTWPVWSALAVTMIVASTGAGMLLTVQPAESAGQAVIPYQPVCQDGAITVCVHPAYRKMLPETADIINRLAQPLAGLPGVPTRAEQRSSMDVLLRKADLPEGTIVFDLKNAAKIETGYETLTHDVAQDLVADPRSPSRVSYYARLAEIIAAGPDSSGVIAIPPLSGMNPAQKVVADWLLIQIWGDVCEEVNEGAFRCWGWGSPHNPDTKAAHERLSALDPAVRRAWFEEHYVALRAGELTLADLP